MQHPTEWLERYLYIDKKRNEELSKELSKLDKAFNGLANRQYIDRLNKLYDEFRSRLPLTF